VKCGEAADEDVRLKMHSQFLDPRGTHIPASQWPWVLVLGMVQREVSLLGSPGLH
jgi:hypothetical protein